MTNTITKTLAALVAAATLATPAFADELVPKNQCTSNYPRVSSPCLYNLVRFVVTYDGGKCVNGEKFYSDEKDDRVSFDEFLADLRVSNETLVKAGFITESDAQARIDEEKAGFDTVDINGDSYICRLDDTNGDGAISGEDLPWYEQNPKIGEIAKGMSATANSRSIFEYSVPINPENLSHGKIVYYDRDESLSLTLDDDIVLEFGSVAKIGLKDMAIYCYSYPCEGWWMTERIDEALEGYRAFEGIIK